MFDMIKMLTPLLLLSSKVRALESSATNYDVDEIVQSAYIDYQDSLWVLERLRASIDNQLMIVKRHDKHHQESVDE